MTQFEYKNSFTVIIIGGGLAGLSAADYLVNHGAEDVCILEAKNSLGGRIHTIEVIDFQAKMKLTNRFDCSGGQSLF